MKLDEFAPTRSIRARWILQELGVDFEAVSTTLPGGGRAKLGCSGNVPACAITSGLCTIETVRRGGSGTSCASCGAPAETANV